LHFIISLLCHDIGYVRGICRGDGDGQYVAPTAAELQSSNDLFFPLLALPSAQARRAKIRNVGYGVPSDFELNFGRHLPTFGRTDDETT
jgi:hypothetical protein